MSSLIAIEANKVAPEKALHKSPESRRTAVRGLFRSNLLKDLVLKYSNPTQRQLVDCSSPTFQSTATLETATLLEVLGSVQPVRMLVEPRLDLNNPPTTVGWDSESSQGAFSRLVLNLSPHCRTGDFECFVQRPPEPGVMPQRKNPLR